MAPLGTQALSGRLVPPGRPALQGILDHPAPQEKLVSQVLRVPQGKQGQQAPLVPPASKALLELQATLGIQAPQAIQETRGSREKPEPQGLLGVVELRESLAQQASLDYLVLMVKRGPLGLLAVQEGPAPQETQVSLGQWALPEAQGLMVRQESPEAQAPLGGRG